MKDPAAGLALKEMRASIDWMQSAGEHLIGRLWGNASALAARSRPQAVSRLLADARRVPADLRQRAEGALHDLEARRTRILGSLEEQATRLVGTMVKRLSIVSRDEVAELHERTAELERRLDAVARESAARGPLTVAGS